MYLTSYLLLWQESCKFRVVQSVPELLHSWASGLNNYRVRVHPCTLSPLAIPWPYRQRVYYVRFERGKTNHVSGYLVLTFFHLWNMNRKVILISGGASDFFQLIGWLMRFSFTGLYINIEKSLIRICCFAGGGATGGHCCDRHWILDHLRVQERPTLPLVVLRKAIEPMGLDSRPPRTSRLSCPSPCGTTLDYRAQRVWILHHLAL